MATSRFDRDREVLLSMYVELFEAMKNGTGPGPNADLYKTLDARLKDLLLKEEGKCHELEVLVERTNKLGLYHLGWIKFFKKITDKVVVEGDSPNVFLIHPEYMYLRADFSEIIGKCMVHESPANAWLLPYLESSDLKRVKIPVPSHDLIVRKFIFARDFFNKRAEIKNLKGDFDVQDVTRFLDFRPFLYECLMSICRGTVAFRNMLALRPLTMFLVASGLVRKWFPDAVELREIEEMENRIKSMANFNYFLEFVDSQHPYEGKGDINKMLFTKISRHFEKCCGYCPQYHELLFIDRVLQHDMPPSYDGGLIRIPDWFTELARREQLFVERYRANYRDVVVDGDSSHVNVDREWIPVVTEPAAKERLVEFVREANNLLNRETVHVTNVRLLDDIQQRVRGIVKYRRTVLTRKLDLDGEPAEVLSQISDEVRGNLSIYLAISMSARSTNLVAQLWKEIFRGGGASTSTSTSAAGPADGQK